MLGACAVLATGASAATLGKAVHTRINIRSWESQVVAPHHYRAQVFGVIHSPKPRCDKRKVILYFKRDGKRHVRDAGWSSHNGGFGLSGHSRRLPDGFFVRVVKKRVMTARKHYTCWPARWDHPIRR